VVVITKYREKADCRIQLRQSAPKGFDVPPHRRRAREIITGKKDEFWTLAIDRFDRLFEPRNIFVAIEMEIAYLAGDDAVKSRPQTPHRQVHAHDLDFIDRPPPHPMQRPEWYWRSVAAEMFSAGSVFSGPLYYLETSCCHHLFNSRTVRAG
jgi:hypothetical protein